MLHLAMKPTSIVGRAAFGTLAPRHKKVLRALPFTGFDCDSAAAPRGCTPTPGSVAGSAPMWWPRAGNRRALRSLQDAADAEYADACRTDERRVVYCPPLWRQVGSPTAGRQSDEDLGAPIAAGARLRICSTPIDRQNAKRRYRWPCAASLRRRAKPVVPGRHATREPYSRVIFIAAASGSSPARLGTPRYPSTNQRPPAPRGAGREVEAGRRGLAPPRARALLPIFLPQVREPSRRQEEAPRAARHRSAARRAAHATNLIDPCTGANPLGPRRTTRQPTRCASRSRAPSWRSTTR